MPRAIAQSENIERKEEAPEGTPTNPPSESRDWLEFASYLARKHAIKGDLLAACGGLDELGHSRRFRELWQLTELSAAEFAAETAHFFDLKQVFFSELINSDSLADRFSHRFLREMMIFPYRTNASDQVFLAVVDPTDCTSRRAVELVLCRPIVLTIVSHEDIASTLAEKADSEEAPNVPGAEVHHVRDDDVESLRDLASGAPVVRAVNDLFEKAVDLRATDIHIEPFRAGLVIRMRVDGLLRMVPVPADVLSQALLSRIKILSGLNIAERRLPQDGATHLRVAGGEVDVRVATMPGKFGESAVIRLLPRDRGILEFAKLGLAASDESKLLRLLGLPHGIVVVTGPTGSGKTTTLATMLTKINDNTKKILTIEDPIEYDIHGVNQSQVKPEIGFTFASAMRSFLRHDPDVIMVGEVRDAESAEIAIHAALTGHLVLTTLHTENAASAIPRLIDLGVESFLLQSTIRGVVAQRLVRILCEHCKMAHRLTDRSFERDPRYSTLGLRAGDVVFDPVGCERCNGSGYRGRTGIFEIMEISNELRALIGTCASSGDIVRAAELAGMTSLFLDGVRKCRAGVTSAADVLRVATAS
jgi:general secretion pathway protein E